MSASDNCRVSEAPSEVEAAIQDGDRWLTFSHPVLTLSAETPSEVDATIARVDQLAKERGLFAAGYVAYEAGAAYGLSAFPLERLPLAWFACFEAKDMRRVDAPPPGATYQLGPIAPSWSRGEFEQAFDRVKRAIADGDSYQANLTFTMGGEFDGDPKALFADLTAAQQGRYSAYLATGSHAICSASPELFFERADGELRTRPMKGTTRRGLTTGDDERRRQALQQSDKERAENVMIVDMMRNDLGRIAEVGSVSVPELFSTERYPTVWQMTSTVTARTRSSLAEIFAALHPSASVTGAPKVSTTALLRSLEPGPRGVYTGAIGLVRPDGSARFNVAIRTAVVDLAGRRVEFGIGSGIVWDSSPVAEYQECLLKGAVLGRRPRAFDLLETLRWSPQEGFVLLDRHLERLADSASYFGRAFDPARIDAALRDAVDGSDGDRRVRLLLGPSGSVQVETFPLVTSATSIRVGLATAPVERDSVWLYHKTTNRDLYERARAARPDVDEVILWNDRGEVTEGTATNVVVERDGVRLTPPVASGLLPGTFRAALLADREVAEAIVTKEQLRTAQRLWVVNSVHGWRQAELVE
jgi:para-aminobenzoate synthetase/4-amino-4-deoxychorismate lyase